MRKIYDEYLYVPDKGEGVVREKVFFARLFIAIACIVVCMLAMGYNAYAFFTANIESTSNVLQAATYGFVKPTETGETNISVVGNQGKIVKGANEWSYTLDPGTYDVKLTKDPSSTAKTGYAKITVGQGETAKQFYSEQIGGVINTENQQEITSRIIRIKVNTTTVIQIEECWGTYVGNIATPIAENVVVEKQKMIVTTGSGSSVGAWAEPQIVNAANEPAITSETSTQTNSEKATDVQEISQSPVSSSESETTNSTEQTAEEQG